MQWLVKNFGGAFYTTERANRKLQYMWRPKGKKNREIFFLGILPYLVIKRERVILALEYDRLDHEDPETRERMRQKMVNLNKGSVETTRETPQIEGDDIVRTA
jgi:hypothetical protein